MNLQIIQPHVDHSYKMFLQIINSVNTNQIWNIVHSRTLHQIGILLSARKERTFFLFRMSVLSEGQCGHDNRIVFIRLTTQLFKTLTIKRHRNRTLKK